MSLDTNPEFPADWDTSKVIAGAATAITANATSNAKPARIAASKRYCALICPARAPSALRRPTSRIRVADCAKARLA
jgi:hypothetical protein